MKTFFITILALGVVIGLYYFIQSAKSDIVDPEIQAHCDEKLALMRFDSPESRDAYYQECLKGKN